MKYLLLLLPLLGWARVDLQYGVMGRTFPGAGGAMLTSELGYSQLMWGDQANPGKKMNSPLYGLIRPSLQLNSSGVINVIQPELEIYPISFLGFAVGARQTHSKINLGFFDCDQLNCQGRVDSEYVKMRAALGAKGVVLLYEGMWERAQFSKDDRPFGDFKNVIEAQGGLDYLYDQRLVLGYVVNPDTMLGLAWEHAYYRFSLSRKNSFYALLRKNFGKHSWVVTAGSFESSLQGRGFLIQFRYLFRHLPTLKMF